MSCENQNSKKRLLKSQSGLRIVSLNEESTSPFELKEPFWVPDVESPCCAKCETRFAFLTRRHHCRRCGHVYCSQCCSQKLPLPRMCFVDPVRICSLCAEVTKKENEFYDKHLKVLMQGAHYKLDEGIGSDVLIPLTCCLSKDHASIIFDGGNLWQHRPVNLTDVISVHMSGSPSSPGLQQRASIHFRNGNHGEQDIRLTFADVSDRKQSTLWIHGLQKAIKLLSSGAVSP